MIIYHKTSDLNKSLPSIFFLEKSHRSEEVMSHEHRTEIEELHEELHEKDTRFDEMTDEFELQLQVRIQ